MRIYKILLIVSVVLVLSYSYADAEEYKQIRGVIQVHTNFEGSGAHSVDELVALAKESGLEFIIPTDHDLQVMEYGIFPFRNIIKKREERDSVLKQGPENYLALIRNANQVQDDVLVIPGVQSSPFYYWSGNPLGDDFTANAYRKEMLLIGMQNPEDYLGLPLMHSSYSTRYVEKLVPRTSLFVVALLLSVFLAFQVRYIKIIGIILCILNLAFIYNHHPFQSSLFDPYHGDQGVKPFQELINYVNEKGGLAFWAHPESNYAVKGVQLGPAILKTPHYPDDLVRTKKYTGFEAIYGDTITMTKPGKQWDIILNDYCLGKRDKPIWGIAGADFHGESKDDKIDTYQTVVVAISKNHQEILKALSKGRCYPVLKAKNGPNPILDNFMVKSASSSDMAQMGEQIEVKTLPLIQIGISTADNGNYPVHITLNRGGKILKEFPGTTPVKIEYTDQDIREGKTYYRLEADFKGNGRLLSNPIFVNKT